MPSDKRNCVICGESFLSVRHWTCSEACAEVLEARKKERADERAELEVEEPIAVSFEFGTSEAEKARQALAGLDEAATVAEGGKALYRPGPGLLELAESAKALMGVSNEAINVGLTTSKRRLLSMRAEVAAGWCLSRIAETLNGNDSEVVRPAADLPPDDDPDGDEEAEAGAPGEGEARGGHPGDGLGSDPVVVQGDLGDGVPGDGLDDGPAARGGR